MTVQAPPGLPQAMAEEIVTGFAEVADGYDAQGTEFSQTVGLWLSDQAGVNGGAYVLDLGCGKGAVTIPAACAAGPDGWAIGIDAAEPMLEHARKRADDAGLTNVTFRRGYAGSPGRFGPVRFDVILAGLLIQFLPRPAHAVWKWISLMDLDGVLGFTWLAAQDQRWQPVIAAVDAFVPKGKPGYAAFMWRPPFTTIRSVEDMLASAGYRSVRTVTRTVEVTYQTPEQWWVACQSLEQWAVSWRYIPKDQLRSARAEAFRALKPIRASDGSLTRLVTVACTIARPIALGRPWQAGHQSRQ
jgi:SAM-dependent methyltransferase